MSDSDSSVPVPRSRLDHMIEALALVSAGTYVESVLDLPNSAQDAFGEAEVLLAQVLREHLRLVHAVSQRAVQVQRQDVLIERLSTPIIEVWDRVVVLPLIGQLRDADWIHLIERCLAHVQAQRTRCLILDVTGIETDDSGLGQRVLHLIRSAGLLGCATTLCGVRPDLARSLVQRGENVADIRVAPTVHVALRDWLAHGPAGSRHAVSGRFE